MLEATKIKKLNAAADRIGGFNGALAFLDRLPDELARRVLKPAMQAADLIGKQAAAAAASRHESLKRHTHLSATAGAAEAVRGGTVVAKVGYFGQAGSHGWLAEHGHRMVIGGSVARISGKRKGTAPNARARTGKGRVVGQVAPHPILQPAYDASKGAMEQAFANEVIYRTDQVATRLAKQTGAL